MKNLSRKAKLSCIFNRFVVKCCRTIKLQIFFKQVPFFILFLSCHKLSDSIVSFMLEPFLFCVFLWNLQTLSSSLKQKTNQNIVTHQRTIIPPHVGLSVVSKLNVQTAVSLLFFFFFLVSHLRTFLKQQKLQTAEVFCSLNSSCVSLNAGKG